MVLFLLRVHVPWAACSSTWQHFLWRNFSNIQSKCPLKQSELVSSISVICFLGEETKPCLSSPSIQVAVETNKIHPEPPFPTSLSSSTSHLFSQPFTSSLVLLWTCSSTKMSFFPMRNPKVNTGFKAQPHLHRVQRDDPFLNSACHTMPDTSQDGSGLLGHLVTEEDQVGQEGPACLSQMNSDWAWLPGLSCIFHVTALNEISA